MQLQENLEVARALHFAGAYQLVDHPVVPVIQTFIQEAIEVR